MGVSLAGRAAEALWHLGGVTSRAVLLQHVSRAELEAEVRAGVVRRLSRGRYALASLDAAPAAAERLGGVLSFTSAALHHGWAVKCPPTRPHVTVPRGRRMGSGRADGAQVHFGDVRVDGSATSMEQTFLDCARWLPFDEALSVADSALRVGSLDTHDLFMLASRSPRTGRRAALRVAEAADARAANPFESVVRALGLEFPLDLVPQVAVSGVGRHDLVDERRRLVVECDSFAHHSSPDALRRDVERYNGLALRGWRLIRFTWAHAMKEPDYVRAVFALTCDVSPGVVGAVLQPPAAARAD